MELRRIEAILYPGLTRSTVYRLPDRDRRWLFLLEGRQGALVSWPDLVAWAEVERGIYLQERLAASRLPARLISRLQNSCNPK